ncbi:serine hydrolase domain-containing protein [Streptomyces sp. NPDC005408]|uniref:serine hydrolase domain-containing protein n=1 Tax=Streptomyces sp. NPDC005408 TaxID=3155341 RepID=UPI0033B46363
MTADARSLGSGLSRRSAVAGCLAAALTVAAGGVGAAEAATAPTRTATGPLPPRRTAVGPLPPLDGVALRAAISDLAHPAATSAQLRVGGSGGRWYGVAGVADTVSGRSVRPSDRFRAGSVNKAFVATVVLQLVAQRRIGLDDPIGRHLPGWWLPPDFAGITVAQLLNHTSGLPDHRDLPDLSTPEAVVRHRFDRWTPRRWVDTVVQDPLKFRPGTAQEYRGINYVLLALLIQEVTGQHYGAAIRTRLLCPLGLDRTLVPGDDPRLHGPQVRGYLRMTDGSLRDITTYNMSSAWGEGELVSSVDDLYRFSQALFFGVLLPPHIMDVLFTLPPDHVRMLDGTPARYSMGLQKATAKGTTFWGKTGETYGYRTRMFSTRDGQRHFVLSYTPTPLDSAQDMTGRVVAALA